MVEHILKASLDRDLIVTIMYLKGTDITMRNIRVLEIKDDKIKAYCYLRKDTRIFKKESILSASFLNTKALKPHSFNFA
jgi:hypothetical protein